MPYTSDIHGWQIPEDGQEPRLEGNQWVTWADDLQATLEAIDAEAILKDTLANRPAAGNEGVWFLATDGPTVYYDDGSAWVTVAGLQAGQAETINAEWTFGSGLNITGDVTTSPDTLLTVWDEASTKPTVGSNVPVRIRAQSNVAIALQADVSGGSANINWFDYDNDAYVATSTADGEVADPHYSIYIADARLDNNPSQIKGMDLHGGPELGYTEFPHTTLFEVANTEDSNAELRLVPDTDGTGANTNKAQLKLADPTHTDQWGLRYTDGDGKVRLQHYPTGASVLIADDAGVVNVPTTLQEGGSPVLTEADEGAGNGLDSDTVDGYEAAALAVLAENETVTGAWVFSPGLTTGGDIVDDASAPVTVYDRTNQWVPLSALEADSLTVAGNAVTLGGSTGINLADLTTKAHADLDDAPAEAHHNQIQVSDSGAATLTQPTDINFDTNLSVTDDGDGSVTVDASGGSGGGDAELPGTGEIVVDGSTLYTDFATALSNVTEYMVLGPDGGTPYTGEGTIPAGVTVRGAGRENTHIQCNGDGSGGTLTAGLGSTGEGVTIQDLTVEQLTDGNNAIRTDGDCSTIRNVELVMPATATTFALVNGGAYATIEGVHVHDAGATAINNFDAGNGNNGEGIIISECTVVNSGDRGIRSNNDGTTFTGNYVVDCSDDGINPRGANAVVSGNIALNNGTDIDAGASTDAVVVGNRAASIATGTNTTTTGNG